MDISELRKGYRLKELDRSHLKENPFDMFHTWMDEAIEAQIDEPNAMALATVNGNGIPSCRIVLLKGVDERGFVFFTNYESHKSHDIEENPHASLVFYWKELERQVRIDGTVVRTSHEVSQEYFSKRPRGSQIGAWASEQGKVIENRKEMEARFKSFEEKFKGQEVPIPEFWGGFRLTPVRIEFWQGRDNRMHDRLSYFREKDKWVIKRLMP